MAVSIDEIQVEVTDPSAAAAPTPPGNQGNRVDLRSALEEVLERRMRLNAD